MKIQQNIQVINSQNYLKNCNIKYFPCFKSKIRRSLISENIELQEVSWAFKISHYSDIPCPACGKKMLNIEKFNDISNELSNAKNEEYLDILNKYKQYMRPVEESVFDEIYKISKRPNSSKDLRTLIVGLRNEKLPILQDAQMRLVKKMNSLAKTLPADERLILQRKIKKLKYHIKKTNSEAPFRRKILLDRISKIKIRNPIQYEKLQQIAKNFPTSFDMNSAWIVKYSGKHKQNEDWTSLEIAQRFLSSSIANTDHILAYSKKNNFNDISNYISMHSACNSQKGDKSFLQWLYEDKDNRLKYLAAYFHSVEQLLKEQITDKRYQNYSEYAKNTIFATSRGKVDIKNINYLA